jgi:hypothetical protein
MVEGFLEQSAVEARKLDLTQIDLSEQTVGDITRFYVENYAPMVSLVLYICSTTREFRDTRGSDRLPLRAKPVKTKRGERLFPSDRPTIWDTGYRIGRLIEKTKADHARWTREAGESGTHASPEPHIRKPHWHSFWKGSKKDPENRELVTHWMPPIPVGYKAGEGILPTIYPVR